MISSLPPPPLCSSDHSFGIPIISLMDFFSCFFSPVCFFSCNVFSLLFPILEVSFRFAFTEISSTLSSNPSWQYFLILHVQSLSHVWLFWDLTDCSPPDSSVHRLLQARMLEWVAISSSRESSWSRDETCVSCTGRQILYHWSTWEALYFH